MFYNSTSNTALLLHVSNLRVHRQEDGCTYSYGIPGIEHILLPTRLLTLMHVKRTIP